MLGETETYHFPCSDFYKDRVDSGMQAFGGKTSVAI